MPRRFHCSAAREASHENFGVRQLTICIAEQHAYDELIERRAMSMEPCRHVSISMARGDIAASR